MHSSLERNAAIPLRLPFDGLVIVEHRATELKIIANITYIVSHR
jgi:hypothetical protein